MGRKFLHVLLLKTYSNHKKRSRQYFQQLQLTEGQPKVLTILSGMEGCQQKELAQACGVEPATMTSLLKNMEHSGLIYKERMSLPGGKWAYSIFLTERGRGLSGEVMDMVEQLEETAFRDFTEGEKETFLKLFAKVAENLDKVNEQ
ncbi:MAG: MarR family transcriptional regulator [Lachnospiraceae bacterium]|nr:MarR family transcriptional regulator [Lachnospiraceae bacterium]